LALAVGKSDVSVVSGSIHMEVVRWGRAPTFDDVGVGGLGEILKDVGVGGCYSFLGGVLEGFGKGREG